MDRYVDPLASHLKTMLNYRKFRKGTKSEVDEILKKEKGENPTRIVYCFGISHEHPGTFILSYIRSTNPHHEYIGLYPKGYKFRKRMFEDIDRLVAYFQRHIDDPLQETVPSIRSVAAMVPMRSPGGSDWGGNSDRSFAPRAGRGGDGHPSGAPRPYGGRGRGRGRRDNMNNDRQDGNGDWGSNVVTTGTGSDGGWGSGGGGWGNESGGKKSGSEGGGWGIESGGKKSSEDDDGGWGNESSGGWGTESSTRKSSGGW